MTTVHSEHYQPATSQEIARQRLAASRQEIILLAHLLQASLVVERGNPLRRAVIEHREVARNMAVLIVIALSIVVGALAPQIARTLGIY
jgi:hypothetical protein